MLQPSGPQPPSPWRVPRPEMGRRWERKRSRVETAPGSRGGRRGKAKAKGGCGAVPAAAAAWATGPTRSAQRLSRRSSPASPAFLGATRRTNPTLPRAGSRGIGSLSHFVPSLLGLLPRCSAGQGEVGARWKLSKDWRAGGEEDESRVPAAADRGASGKGCVPCPGEGESRRRKPGGVGR